MSEYFYLLLFLPLLYLVRVWKIIREYLILKEAHRKGWRIKKYTSIQGRTEIEFDHSDGSRELKT